MVKTTFLNIATILPCFILGIENDINLKADSHFGLNLLERNWLKRLSWIVYLCAVQGLNDFDDVTFEFDDVLSRREKMQRMCWNYVRFAFNYIDGLNNFNVVTFAFDDVL